MTLKEQSRIKNTQKHVKMYNDLGLRIHPHHGIKITTNGVECTCDSYRRKVADRDGSEFVPCASPGKRPYLPKWQDKATADIRQAAKWFLKKHGGWPLANVGIATGPESDLFVIDVDGEEGKAAFDELVKVLGPLPPTVIVETGGGGIHYWFKYPKGYKLRNTAKKLGNCIDTRGEGGTIIVPPSMHASGNFYNFREGCSPKDVEIAPLPIKWVKECGGVPLEDVGTHSKNISEKDSIAQSKPTGTSRAASTGLPSPRLQTYLDKIGDHEDGFDNPINSAAISFMIANGADPSSSERLKELLRDRIRNAPKREGRDVEQRYTTDEYLDERIEKARQFALNNSQTQKDAKPNNPVFASVDALLAYFNARYAVLLMGSNPRYLFEEDGEVQFLTPTAFNEWTKPLKLAETNKNGELKFKDASAIWKSSPERRQYSRVVFEPNGSPPSHYNLYAGLAVSPRKGKWKRLLRHLYRIICRGDIDVALWVLAWLAQIVQAPHVKFGTALVLLGRKGTGKTKLFEHYSTFFGRHAITLSNQRQVTGNFNAHLGECIFAVLEEAIWAGNKTDEGQLKHLITGEKMVLERKGIDAFEINNYLHLAFTSNEDRAIPVTGDERRFMVLNVSDEHMQDTEYFGAIDDEMFGGGREAMLYDLMRFDYTRFDLRNPPSTPALSGQISENLSSIHAWWHDCLVEGCLVGLEPHSVKCEKDLEEWPVDHAFEISRTSVQESYLAVVHEYGRKQASISRLGGFLKKVEPRIEDKRSGSDGARERVYVFPPLSEMRSYYEKKFRISLDERPGAEESDDPFFQCAKEMHESFIVDLFDDDDSDFLYAPPKWMADD